LRGEKEEVFDLIYRLNCICPSVLRAVLPQLEFNLKSTEERERMATASLLFRMFRHRASI
jgi:sister-chromatid-cohesion protein PDS5